VLGGMPTKGSSYVEVAHIVEFVFVIRFTGGERPQSLKSKVSKNSNNRK